MAQKTQVTVYGTSHCPYCTMAKDFFKKHNVKFTDYDVEKDPARGREMVAKSGQMGVPVIEIGETLIVGFDEEGIKDALKIK